ncbi:hypothetical protein [Paenibacillus dakarensis]|uniref:hypothetical protein n=1 Tax=Paenibacillus dakarensis TaxID=1527293 RepID=UPI0006D54FB8|nr:hypothetical protein [Paenibacillus dakarensis]
MDVFIIVDRRTGKLTHSRALYTDLTNAKSALRRSYGDYAKLFYIAKVSGSLTPVTAVDENGKWAEVGAE